MSKCGSQWVENWDDWGFPATTNHSGSTTPPGSVTAMGLKTSNLSQTATVDDSNSNSGPLLFGKCQLTCLPLTATASFEVPIFRDFLGVLNLGSRSCGLRWLLFMTWQVVECVRFTAYCLQRVVHECQGTCRLVVHGNWDRALAPYLSIVL
jgi:hypothetical protein